MLKRADTLAGIAGDYDVILSDVWGVVHNGVAAFPAACRALAAAREAGTTVVLITNSPRRRGGVARQLEELGVPRNCYDRIVTSGDVTRHLIEAGPSRIFFIGTERDHDLFADLHADAVGEDEAEAVLCTGLFDDETEEPEDYRPLLERFSARRLPFICANPDLVVERGDRLVPCAGSLAAIYAELGGETRISGKPYPPIYEAALQEARAAHGNFDDARVLAIGDGLATDVRGAEDYGLDALYVSGGIHARDYAGPEVVDEERLHAYLGRQGVRPRFWMQHLV